MIVSSIAAMPLCAHPLDDNADRKAQLRVLRDGGIELSVEFYYRNVIASYTEFSNKLDRNNDGTVIREEVTQRFIDLAGEIAFDIHLFVDGERAGVEPDYDRFEFRDLDNPDADIADGIATPSARIFYRLVFVAGAALNPGPHTVQFYFTGTGNTVHTPSEQLTGVGADGQPLTPTYDVALEAFQRMAVEVMVEPHPVKPDPPPQPQGPAPETRAPEPPVGELPTWAVHTVGGVLGLLGLLLLAARVVRKRGSWLAPILLLIAAAGIVLGALARAGGLE
jgi:hypothetical protein